MAIKIESFETTEILIQKITSLSVSKRDVSNTGVNAVEQ